MKSFLGDMSKNIAYLCCDAQQSMDRHRYPTRFNNNRHGSANGIYRIRNSYSAHNGYVYANYG